MPKYYIYDGTEYAVIEADSPLQACFRAIKHRFESIPINGFYRISEQGFEIHQDDVLFSSDEVIHALMDMIERQRTRKNKGAPPDIGDKFWDEKKTRRKRKKPKKDEDED